ncbi:sugar kinase, partial [Enterococcus faecium]
GLRETLYGNATTLATKNLQILPAYLGDRSGSMGSAMMVLDHVLGPAAVDALVTTP